VAVVVLLGGVRTGWSAQPQQWRVSEFSFTAQQNYEKPLLDVCFSAVFEGPKGEKYAVPGFWDGGGNWKIRFTPTGPGKWSYQTHGPQQDNGLDGIGGTFTAAPAEGDNLIYRHGGMLKVSANQRYLTYADGTPFFWLGDTWWYCPSELVPFKGSSNPKIKSAYKTMIDTRKGQGYTIVHMAFLNKASHKAKHWNPWFEYRQSKSIDVNFWREVDRYMDYANGAGIIPMIGLAFSKGVDLLSLEDWKVLWRYVLARYGAHGITWLICGEYNQQNYGNVKERVPKTLALGRYIKDTDPYKRAMTVHAWWYKGDDRSAWKESWYDFILLQGAHKKDEMPGVEVYFDIYGRRPAKPLLEGECRYEGIRGYTAADVREVAYRAIQAGSFGYTYGSQSLWYPTQDEKDHSTNSWGKTIPWWEALKRPGGAQMQHLRACYESVDWWKLEPQPNVVRVEVNLHERQQILVKAEADKTYVIYFPSKLPPTLPAGLIGLSDGMMYIGEWIDPRTGHVEKLVELLKVVNNRLQLPARKNNQDWLFILRKVKE
jgi:hypothetical protein